MSKIGIRDVIAYFKEADLDNVELALELGQDTVTNRRAAKEAVSKRLQKARAARGKNKETAVAEAPAPQAAQPARQRHGGEPAGRQSEAVAVG